MTDNDTQKLHSDAASAASKAIEKARMLARSSGDVVRVCTIGDSEWVSLFRPDPICHFTVQPDGTLSVYSRYGAQLKTFGKLK